MVQSVFFQCYFKHVVMALRDMVSPATPFSFSQLPQTVPQCNSRFTPRGAIVQSYIILHSSPPHFPYPPWKELLQYIQNVTRSLFIHRSYSRHCYNLSTCFLPIKWLTVSSPTYLNFTLDKFSTILLSLAKIVKGDKVLWDYFLIWYLISHVNSLRWFSTLNFFHVF